jgi:hypothetical protein
MTEETNVLDPPGGVTKRRGRGAGCAGSHGAQGDDGDGNDPLIDDFKRPASMLARIVHLFFYAGDNLSFNLDPALLFHQRPFFER